jgi:hypothetical protein
LSFFICMSTFRIEALFGITNCCNEGEVVIGRVL